MAQYEKPQPIWKRNLAGILDFIIVFIPLGILLMQLPGNPPPRGPFMTPSGIMMTEIRLNLTNGILQIVLTIAYFVIMNRTGGTLFQRLFRMRHAK